MRRRAVVLWLVAMLLGSVSIASTGQASANRSIDPDTIEAGETFRVVVTVTVSENINGLGLDEEVPSGWSVAPVDNGGGYLAHLRSPGFGSQQLRDRP